MLIWQGFVPWIRNGERSWKRPRMTAESISQSQNIQWIFNSWPEWLTGWGVRWFSTSYLSRSWNTVDVCSRRFLTSPTTVHWLCESLMTTIRLDVKLTLEYQWPTYHEETTDALYSCFILLRDHEQHICRIRNGTQTRNELLSRCLTRTIQLYSQSE